MKLYTASLLKKSVSVTQVASSETDQNVKEESQADDPDAAFVIPDDLTW